MIARQFLGRIGEIAVMITRLEQKRALLISRATRMSAPLKEVQVRTSVPEDPMGEIVCKIHEVDSLRERLINRMLDLRETIEGMLSGMESQTQAELLYRRYVELKELRQIADEMGLSYDYVKHLHGRALDSFQEIYMDKE